MPGANLTRVEAEERKSIVQYPIHYSVDLDLTQGDTTFVSTSTIQFGAKAGESTFLDLIADEVTSVTLNGESVEPGEVFADDRIALNNLRERNEVVVTAVCRYSTTGEGLHRSVDPSDGNVYLYSQFEVPDARRVYAVFDQPDLKAVFRFSVLAPCSWIVTSNMPVERTEDTDQMTLDGTLGTKPAEHAKRWTFAPTPTMSSYLTAICAGPYAEWHTTYQNEDGRTIPMAQYCRQALKDDFAKDVDYLFDITKKGFAFYAKTWGVPYPYAKYDQIYVPEYNAGAMENIGMVTIRDSYVFSSKVTDALAERRVVTVLHELAHMWFGDYVTMKWWNDLWLNESFAEFTSTLATAEATEWKDAWATFCSGEKSWALNQDQLSTTHPIVAPINDLNDTYVNFDGITYAKGASVLKQLVAYVGRSEFFEGINHYLYRHAYSNATLNDLLTELEGTSGRDLKTWSAQWLEQAGINTIATDLHTAQDGTISELTLHQFAPTDHPVLREHRLAVGFYNEDEESGKVVRTDRIELDVDGEATTVTEAAGKPRPQFLLTNDDDLTYTKLRFDDESLAFATANLYRFDDALARAVIWLALWDMTRDGELAASDFIGTTLKLLSTETESTTFRYALACLSTTVWHYTDRTKRAAIAQHTAQALLDLAKQAPAGSDMQFQLISAYLTYGVEGDSAFADTVRGLLSGSLVLEGLELDNNFRWSLVRALSSINAIDEADIQQELERKDTTENREFALAARAARATAEAKAWAWNEAIHDEVLTNAQLESVAGGFASTPSQELAEPYVKEYFDSAEWIWNHKTFHMAEALLEGLYPRYADPATLVELGDKWLASHADADNALRRLISANVESSHRTKMVADFNASLNDDIDE
ncbi:aminopeptidase N [Bifidobacterium pseudolongum subsp. globosum]|jgi:aminopeptidase N|uniref:Aminopeptidase N n=3 Tax=Bifidobacterium pseudolongum TaxID=1694 RepID=A0A0A7I8X4_9BIFI|nr:aminopeptidase N [Bifidobacterium pseudolongum]AIZ16718.1 aminopeptidase N [Bifidobacterium pseudolongum PV8-2]MCH4835678.1 aminopeptidase N [Bifidobacterium pseudolongum]MCH4843144.1 aminopeptidase N [Bifidobacterium pseudolongum]MCH4850296.1 aminopeptidase N [Bifidobacterium pseudolongum]MCH4851898.1 aminopeptidase N [Bifidobacterium pseudolongum]